METPPDPLAATLATLGEDLLLLSVRPRDGVVKNRQHLGYGLMGSELVRLAALRRVDVDRKTITVLSQLPTGDAELDVALASLVAARRPRPRSWVGHPRRGILDTYLRRLADAGVLRGAPGGLLDRMRWTVVDQARAQDRRARLDAIAYGDGPVDVAQAAFGGLAHAVDLDDFLYPRFAERGLRKRLLHVSEGRLTQLEPPTTAGPAVGAATTATADAVRAADAAAAASAQAATDAAVQAAVQAATSAATAAAVAAASAAASSAAGDAGAHGGGHGGGGGGGGHGH
jgi:hypothetical protein